MKNIVLEPLFNKVAGLQACNFIKKRLQHKCFPANVAKILRTAFSIEQHHWLLLFVLSNNPGSIGATKKCTS